MSYYANETMQGAIHTERFTD